MGGDPEI
jgi:vesicle coat complex subunit